MDHETASSCPLPPRHLLLAASLELEHLIAHRVSLITEAYVVASPVLTSDPISRYADRVWAVFYKDAGRPYLGSDLFPTEWFRYLQAHILRDLSAGAADAASIPQDATPSRESSR